MSGVLAPPWSVRSLSEGEAALLNEVFGSALDVSRLRIWSCPILNWTTRRAFCAGGWLWPGKSLLLYPTKAALADFAGSRTPISATATFVHECTHAAQSQAGVNLLWAKLKAGDSDDSYRYALGPDSRWEGLNIEQQAMVVEHAFLCRRRRKTPYDLDAYAAVCPYPVACAGDG